MENIICTYVLDRTGSMSSIWDATVSGFNEFKNEQSRQPGDAWLTLLAFDAEHKFDSYELKSQMEVPYYAWNCKDIPDLDPRGDIKPRGMTPLFDAIAHAIYLTEKWLNENKDWFKGKVLVAINTDGLENSSVEIKNRDKIKSMIEDKQNVHNWGFSFMGAGIDAFAEGVSLGISKEGILQYDHNPSSALVSNRVMSNATSSYRSSINERFSYVEQDDEEEESNQGSWT